MKYWFRDHSINSTLLTTTFNEMTLNSFYNLSKSHNNFFKLLIESSISKRNAFSNWIERCYVKLKKNKRRRKNVDVKMRSLRNNHSIIKMFNYQFANNDFYFNDAISRWLSIVAKILKKNNSSLWHDIFETNSRYINE